MPADRHPFRKSALLSGLVTQAQLDEALASIRRETVGPPLPDAEISDDVLAARLVKSEVLTTYQAEQLKAGRNKLSLGAYVIKDWIGQGGMGQVFKGEHTVMGREVAIKVLPRNKSTPESIASFTREIRTQAKLDHSLLVRAYDAGHDGQVYYLVCEFVPGTDLRRLVREQGPLTMPQAAKVIRQAALALHYAHQQGLIHRDVKPGNILVTPDGVAKVSDLGLAACLEEDDADPRAGKIVGTADYLSPDQIKTPKNLTAATDVYSLGCTLYYAATGKVPFPGGTSREKAKRHCEEPPLHPRRFNPDLSEEFVDVIADMMEKDPHERIQTAEEVAARLEPWANQSVTMPQSAAIGSPWQLPPPPSDVIEDELRDTEDGGEDPAVESSPQISQSTNPDAQYTRSVRKPPLPRAALPAPPRDRLLPFTTLPSQETLLLILLVSIPVSMALGALFMFLVMQLFR